MMTETITWRRVEADTTSGYKLVIIRTFTSQNIEAINDLQEYCEQHLGSATRIEHDENIKKIKNIC